MPAARSRATAAPRPGSDDREAVQDGTDSTSSRAPGSARTPSALAASSRSSSAASTWRRDEERRGTSGGRCGGRALLEYVLHVEACPLRNASPGGLDPWPGSTSLGRGLESKARGSIGRPRVPSRAADRRCAPAPPSRGSPERRAQVPLAARRRRRRSRSPARPRNPSQPIVETAAMPAPPRSPASSRRRGREPARGRRCPPPSPRSLGARSGAEPMRRASVRPAAARRPPRERARRAEALFWRCELRLVAVASAKPWPQSAATAAVAPNRVREIDGAPVGCGSLGEEGEERRRAGAE